MRPQVDRPDDGPQPLGQVLSRLMTLRGYGRVESGRQLTSMWQEVAGREIAGRSRVIGVRNGVLQVGVANAALLSELAGFHRHSLLEALWEHPLGTEIREIKFRLRAK